MVEGVPFLAFQLFVISGPKSNVAIRSSSNSSTLSSVMLKLSKADLLAGVKIKSFLVLSTSVRPDTVQEKANYTTVGSFICINSQHLTCHLGPAKNSFSE